MNRQGTLSALFAAAIAFGSAISDPSFAQTQPYAFLCARIIPVDGPEISNATLLIQQGRILAVGPSDRVSIPDDAVRFELRNATLMAGLVCSHSHVGGIGGADSSAPIQPDVRVYDSLNVRDSGYRRAVAGGLTTLNVMPGSGHLLSGQTVYLKLRDGAKTIEDFFIRGPGGEPMGGVKMANGTNSQKEPPFPGTRGKSAALVRQMFLNARDYQRKVEAAAGDPEKTPDRNLANELLAQVLDGTKTVHHHTHRHDDIITVLRLAKEFNFRVVLHHVSEGWKVADEIARAGVPCSIILVDSPGGKQEARDLVFETGGVLERAGVKVAYHTDDWITDSRLFLRMAALGVRGGMSREGALRAVTLSGAEILGLGGRVGSLTPGKDADFIILSGDPFSVYTKVLQTWVEGKKVFDRDAPQDRLSAVGGFGASRESTPYFCCFDGGGE